MTSGPEASLRLLFLVSSWCDDAKCPPIPIVHELFSWAIHDFQSGISRIDPKKSVIEAVVADEHDDVPSSETH